MSHNHWTSWPNSCYRNLTTPGYTSVEEGERSYRTYIFIDKYFMPTIESGLTRDIFIDKYFMPTIESGLTRDIFIDKYFMPTIESGLTRDIFIDKYFMPTIESGLTRDIFIDKYFMPTIESGLTRDIFIDKYFMPFQASYVFKSTIESDVPFSKHGKHGREWALFGSKYHMTLENWDLYNTNLPFIPIKLQCIRKMKTMTRYMLTPIWWSAVQETKLFPTPISSLQKYLAL